MKDTDRLYRVKPKDTVRLADFPTAATGHYKDQDQALDDLQKHRKRLDQLQELFAIDGRHALLIVLQGMDTGGKDGTIRHIFTGVNPQGCDVTPFKVPSPLEARHDFLWRAHNAVPPRGMIGIFNRSHYEDVLVVRVHGQITGKQAHQRMRDIVHWEEMLTNNSVIILKFFLHISFEEQTRRLQARLQDPAKRWKLSASDIAERKLWPKYQDAYEDVLSRTSRKAAPWYIVPADHKWYRNVVISRVIVETLENLKLKHPKPAIDPSTVKL
jgi:PPK2 family polyphosphate:nucleotide phosphotransferase